MLAEMRKAWTGALASGLAATAAAAYQIDFTAITANNIRDLVVTFILAAMMAGGVTWVVPNRPKPNA